MTAGTPAVAGSDGELWSEVSAPPELRTTTSGATELAWVVSVGDCEEASVVLGPVVGCVVVAEFEDTVDSGGVAIDPAFVASVAAVAEPVESVELSASGVAVATPGVVATAIPTPSATASAPILPMYAQGAACGEWQTFVAAIGHLIPARKPTRY